MKYKTLFSKTKELSVLLVEDYEPLRSDMAEMLDDLFKRVTVAENGREALGIYQKSISSQQCYDLIITDIEMPEMNGVSLSKAIYDINVDQQIIVLSAYTDSKYLLEFINLGIARFITKPIDHQVFMDTLYHVSRDIHNTGTQIEASVILKLGENHTWNKESFLLKHEDNTINLTRHELLLMQLLVKTNEQISTNDGIMQYFYTNGIDINEKSIRNLIFKLRKKLPDGVIESIYGMGYKFTPLP